MKLRWNRGQDSSLSYIGNNLIYTKTRVILANKVMPPGVATKSDAVLVMLDTIAQSGMPFPSKN